MLLLKWLLILLSVIGWWLVGWLSAILIFYPLLGLKRADDIPFVLILLLIVATDGGMLGFGIFFQVLPAWTLAVGATAFVLAWAGLKFEMRDVPIPRRTRRG